MILFTDKRNYGMLLLRVCTAAILMVHGVAGMLNDGLSGFGSYLDTQGFAPLGLPLAWGIKLSHVLAAGCIVIRKWELWPCLLTIVILVAGIFMVHLPHGWFVVGGGFNGIEFNLLLIGVLVAILFENRPNRSAGVQG